MQCPCITWMEDFLLIINDKFPMQWDLRIEMRTEVWGNVSLTIHATALCSHLGQLTLSPESWTPRLQTTFCFVLLPYIMSYHRDLISLLQVMSHHLKSQSVCTVSFTTGLLHSGETLHNLFAMQPNSLSCISLCHRMLPLKYLKQMML